MKKMKILISGGPVHSFLDNVKIITNRFKGGLISQLAMDLMNKDEEVEITYLTSKDSHYPPQEMYYYNLIYHNGIEDYMDKVLELAPEMDAVILGAAVANLIPAKKIEGKFPSHNYKPGDIIPIDFTIAPRIIDEVKKVAPKTHLFGFKLLSNVDEKELVRAAYGVLLESKATAIIGNDTSNLDIKYIVTKERGVHKILNDYLCKWILEMINDEYYTTNLIDYNGEEIKIKRRKDEIIKIIINENKNNFIVVEKGMIFGTVAMRHPDGGFITTGRGKKELEEVIHVLSVDHDKKIVYTRGTKKATLNAPLLDTIFRINKEVDYIIHYHTEKAWLENRLDYAPPGTVRDSIRKGVDKSFNIKNHGCFMLYNKRNELIK